jgi:alcohol dehydrogenase
VHGKPALLHLEEQWTRDITITITTGLVDTSSTPTLMRLVGSGQLAVGRFVTHRFGMDDFERAYDVFGDAGSGALKVVLTHQEEADE